MDNTKTNFDILNQYFSFTLDPCCTEETHLCPTFFTAENNGLSQTWKGHRVFMNPPYGRQIGKWIQKAFFESIKNNVLVVGLIPARTDTRWWHEYIQNHADILFISGRLKFGNSKNSAPFPSAVVIWYGQERIRLQA